MLRPYNGRIASFTLISVLVFVALCLCGFRCFAALGTNVDIFAEGNFDGFENVLVVETEALAIGNVAHVGAELPIGPQKITDGSEQLLDVIVLLDQLRDVAGGASGGNVFERLRGLRVEANGRNILR